MTPYQPRQARSPGRSTAVRPLRLVAYTDATYCAGAETSLATLLTHLSPAIDVTVLGVDATVVEWIASRRPGARWQVVRRVGRKRDLRAMLDHQAALWRLRPNVFQANLNTPWACRGAIVAALATPGTRVVSVEHTLLPAASGRLRRRTARLSRLLAGHVAVGGRLARELEAMYRLPAGSIRTIHTGVEQVRGEEAPRSRAQPVIGYVGRLSWEKALDVLLRAVASIPGADLVLVGDGPERPRLEALARDLGLADRVVFEGWRTDARRYLPSFEVLALPSVSEGFGLSIVEAMLAGLPVVASDVGSVCEAVLDRETGLLVPPGDVAALAAALNRLLGDAELAARMGEAGREVARERFSPQAMARAFESLYAELLANRRLPRGNEGSPAAEPA